MNKIDLDILKSLYINKYSNQIDLSKINEYSKEELEEIRKAINNTQLFVRL